jgi:hypothetical protein
MESITVRNASGSWKGLAHLCPKCTETISVQIDPMAIKMEIVEEIQAIMGRARR